MDGWKTPANPSKPYLTMGVNRYNQGFFSTLVVRGAPSCSFLLAWLPFSGANLLLVSGRVGSHLCQVSFFSWETMRYSCSDSNSRNWCMMYKQKIVRDIDAAIHKHCDIHLLNQIHVCAYLDLNMQIKMNNKTYGHVSIQTLKNQLNKYR